MAPVRCAGRHKQTDRYRALHQSRRKSNRETAKVKTPAGEWDNAIQFSFEQSCADAGMTTMYFVPDLGPVAYETTTLAGPVRWELIYARSGSTTAEAPQVGFTIALNAPVYKKPDATSMLVRLTLRNTSGQPVTLVFTPVRATTYGFGTTKANPSMPGRRINCSRRLFDASNSRRASAHSPLRSLSCFTGRTVCRGSLAGHAGS